MSTRISEKCSREFAYFVHENSPFLSTKILPPSDVGKLFNFLEDSLKGHAWIIFHSAREVDGTLHCTARALYMGELRKNTTSTGTITKKPGYFGKFETVGTKKIYEVFFFIP